MNDNNEIRKDKKYEVAFFTLLGFVLVVSISTLAFVISSNKDKTKKNDEKIISNKIDSSNETYIYEESNTNIDNTSNNTSNTTSNKINTLSDTEISNTDDKVISYLTEKQKEVSGKISKESAKNMFITIVDFLFYDGKINGCTFNELSDKGKVEVSKLCTDIEISIEDKFPGAIDEIKSKYSNKKEQVMEIYNTTIDNYCNSNKDICDEFKKDFENMKSSFSKTFGVIKDIGEKGKEKLSQWYSNFKNN